MQRQHFSTYLIAGFVILILASTISAGVPAYWITRNQLERQAWGNVENARQATASLLVAEQNRLRDLATIFAERPTLRRLVQTNDLAELQPFVRAFKVQSKVDLLLFCTPTGERLAGTERLDRCPAIAPPHFTLIANQPALMVSQPVEDSTSATLLGLATVGIWLDQSFLAQLRASTGMEQTVLLPTGERLTSSMVTAPPPVTAGENLVVPTSALALTLADQPYYVARLPLVSAAADVPFYLEVALPVAELLATERRALLILIISTGLVTLLGVALATWYVRRLTEPLLALTQVAERMSSGDFVAPIPAFATPGEVATLSTALIKSQASMLRALDERAQARDWLNNLIQSIVEGVVTFDPKGRITFLSQGAESLLGWTSAEAMGESIDKLLPPADATGEPFWQRIPQPGGKRLLPTCTRAGRAMTLAVTGARLAPPHAKTAQVALVLRDVTHEEALRNLRSYFLANISHEFKTPISTLNASLELLLDSTEDYSVDEIREVLKPAHLSLLSLQNLIDNLLQSSSIEAGHFVIRKRPVALYHVVEDGVRLVQPLLDRRRQHLSIIADEVLLDSVVSREIQADKGRLTQVLVNLLVNASKYSPIGGPIELTLAEESALLRLTVADRGPGIPPLERLNLFRRFVRLEAQDSEEYGIGLGLYVVKTTIEAHGGQVGVDDRAGGGSVFWVELPMVNPEGEERGA
ncbi:MAG: PAS domain S-box protein [Caldilineaceae bacterium]|nr:PAS domain S-box protein [Caldilineaceae bacterium]